MAAEQLTPDALCRTLDAVAAYGPQKLFSACSAQICRALGVAVEAVHLDSTSFYCDAEEEEEEDGCELKIGSEKEQEMRPDLMQLNMAGLMDGSSGLPICMESSCGSGTDHKSLFARAARDWPVLSAQFADLQYLVIGSALCTADILAEAVQRGMHLVTRRADSSQVAKNALQWAWAAVLPCSIRRPPTAAAGCGAAQRGSETLR